MAVFTTLNPMSHYNMEGNMLTYIRNISTAWRIQSYTTVLAKWVQASCISAMNPQHAELCTWMEPQGSTAKEKTRENRFVGIFVSNYEQWRALWVPAMSVLLINSTSIVLSRWIPATV